MAGTERLPVGPSYGIVLQEDTEMIFVGFVLFAILVIAWLAAPSTDKKAITASGPVLQLSESPAD